MNAWLQLNTASEPMLLIPSQALIDTGNMVISHEDLDSSNIIIDDEYNVQGSVS